MKARTVAVAAALAAALAVGCARAGRGGGAAGQAQNVVVSSAGMKFDPAVITAPANANLRITFQNRDTVEHNLTIPALNAKMSNVPPGASGRLEVTTKGSGSYDVICTVPGHRESGMLAKLEVR